MNTLRGCVLIRGIYNQDLINRFMYFVPIRNGGECWIWDGGLNSKGYGQFRIGHYMYLAHRVSYEIYYGAIPPGLLALHKCDVKRCVNPDHIELGDHSKNIQDRYARIKDTGRGYSISKFTLEDKDKMEQLRSTGMTFVDIGKLFKCSERIIRNIVNGKVTHFKGQSK